MVWSGMMVLHRSLRWSLHWSRAACLFHIVVSLVRWLISAKVFGKSLEMASLSGSGC